MLRWQLGNNAVKGRSDTVWHMVHKHAATDDDALVENKHVLVTIMVRNV